MIRARSARPVGSVRDREISSKRCRCSASVGSAITRRGAANGSPNPIPARLLPHLVQDAKPTPNILIFRNLYTRYLIARLYLERRVVGRDCVLQPLDSAFPFPEPAERTPEVCLSLCPEKRELIARVYLQHPLERQSFCRR